MNPPRGESALMNKFLWAIASLLWFGSGTACTSVAESAASVEASDSAGITIVHSRGAQWKDGEGWTVPSEPQQSIGVMSGPLEYQLVDVSSAARQTNGNVVVADRGARTVRLYQGDGTFLKTLGGPGSGPEEFENPGQVMVTAGDTVVVWDEALFRTTRFDPSGELVDVATLDLGTIAKAATPPLYPGRVDLLPDGQFLIRLIEKGKISPSGRFRQRSGALRVSEDLSVIDTLMFFGDIEQESVDAPWGQFAISPPLARRPRITHRGVPPKVCMGDQEGPEINCFGPDGSRTLLRWTGERTQVTREEIATWREANIRLFGLKLREDQILQMLDQLPSPELRPHYSQLTLDPLGNLWVELGPSVASPSPSIDHLVFDPKGTLLGTVCLPPIRVIEIGNDYILGVYQDDLEIEYLQLYEIRKPSSGTDEM